jgi:hypothetical protein
VRRPRRILTHSPHPNPLPAWAGRGSPKLRPDESWLKT